MDGDVVRVRGKERDERWLGEWWPREEAADCRCGED